jgi:hypothetical protein
MSLDNITVNGEVYTPIFDRESSKGCNLCAFRNGSNECTSANKFVDCARDDVYFVPVSTVDLRSNTHQMQDWKGFEANHKPQTPGTKYDQGKFQYTLVPPYALQEVARNLTEGLKKYKERNNWQKVEGAEQRYMDALMRHFEAIRRGEIYDVDSSDPTISHMSAVAVNAMFLLEFMYNPELKGKQ